MSPSTDRVPAGHLIPAWDACPLRAETCCGCNTPLSKDESADDATAIFTVLPPWRDWRPIRYVCRACSTSPETINLVRVVDSLHLRLVEVIVPPEWTKCKTLCARPWVSSQGEDSCPTATDYQMYSYLSLCRENEDNVAWLRLIRNPDTNEDVVAVHLLNHNRGQSSAIYIVPLSKMEEWNPTLPPFRYCLPHPEGVSLDRLHDVTPASKLKWLNVLWQRMQVEPEDVSGKPPSEADPSVV